MKAMIQWARRTAGALILVGMGVLTPASSAYAICDGCVVGAVNLATLAITTANSAIVSAIMSAQLSIVDAVKGVGSAQSAMQAQVAQAASDANVDAQASMQRAANVRAFQL